MDYCPEGNRFIKAWKQAYKVYCATAPKVCRQAAEEYFRVTDDWFDHFEQCPICQKVEREKGKKNDISLS